MSVGIRNSPVKTQRRPQKLPLMHSVASHGSPHSHCPHVNWQYASWRWNKWLWRIQYLLPPHGLCLAAPGLAGNPDKNEFHFEEYHVNELQLRLRRVVCSFRVQLKNSWVRVGYCKRSRVQKFRTSVLFKNDILWIRNKWLYEYQPNEPKNISDKYLSGLLKCS